MRTAIPDSSTPSPANWRRRTSRGRITSITWSDTPITASRRPSAPAPTWANWPTSCAPKSSRTLRSSAPSVSASPIRDPARPIHPGTTFPMRSPASRRRARPCRISLPTSPISSRSGSTAVTAASRSLRRRCSPQRPMRRASRACGRSPTCSTSLTPTLAGITRVPVIRETGPPAWFDEPLVRETIAPALIRARAQMYETRKREGTPARPVFDAINVRKLHAAGVRQVLGSDAAGDGNRWLGLHTLLEFDNMVAAGFTPMEMIVAATRDSAKVLRLDQLGMVAARQSADFIVLHAKPLHNIANVRKINAVYLRGEAVDRAGLRAKWQAQWREKGQL